MEQVIYSSFKISTVYQKRNFTPYAFLIRRIIKHSLNLNITQKLVLKNKIHKEN